MVLSYNIVGLFFFFQIFLSTIMPLGKFLGFPCTTTYKIIIFRHHVVMIVYLAMQCVVPSSRSKSNLSQQFLSQNNTYGSSPLAILYDDQELIQELSSYDRING